MDSSKPNGPRYSVLDCSYVISKGTMVEQFMVFDGWRGEIVAKFRGRIAAKRYAAESNELYGSDSDWELFSAGMVGA